MLKQRIILWNLQNTSKIITFANYLRSLKQGFMAHRKLLLWVFTALFAFACGNDFEKQVVSTYPDDSPRVVQYFKWVGNSRVVKKEVRYFSNGEKELEGPLKNGKKHGVWTQWYRSGEKWTETTYKQGKRNGKMTEWYKSGEISYIARYKDGVPHGEWIFYDGVGNKTRKIIYKNGRKQEEIQYD